MYLNHTIAAMLMVIASILMSSCEIKTEQKVGLLIHQEDDRWAMDVAYLKQYFQEENIQLILKNAQGDENLQLKQVKELVDAKVDLILIVAVNQNTAAGIVRYANEHHTPIIAYDRIVNNSNVDYILSFKYEEVGRQLAQYTLQNCPKGNYVLFWGDAFDNNARMMQKSQMEVLKPHIENGDINIVYKGYIDDWKYENVYHQMNEIIDFSSTPIHAVIANNDVLAVGTIDALEHNNKTEPILVTGHDATLESCRLIMQDKQAMTIYKPISTLAHTAVNMSMQLIRNETITVNDSVFNGKFNVPSILLNPIIVDKQNLESIVIADGLHTKEEVFQSIETN